MIKPDRWIEDFDSFETKLEVRPKILKEIAARLVGLGD